MTSKFPKWAIAYKFQAEQRAHQACAPSTCRSGARARSRRSRSSSPSSSRARRCRGRRSTTPDMIETLDVRVGDHVFIQKAGEIIPQVVERRRASADAQGQHRSSRCRRCAPSCGTPVVRELRDADKPELGYGAATRCPNRACPEQVKQRIFYFARRFAMDVDHLGHRRSSSSSSTNGHRQGRRGPLRRSTAERIAELERMGEKSAQNVFASIQRSKERTLDRLALRSRHPADRAGRRAAARRGDGHARAGCSPARPSSAARARRRRSTASDRRWSRASSPSSRTPSSAR